MAALRFSVKLALFVFVLAACQMAVYGLFESRNVPMEIDLLDRLLLSRTPVVYLGDSTVNGIAQDDEDRRCLSAMVQDLLPDARVGVICHGGYHARVFEHQCSYMARTDNPPSVVIVPINLRSFSPVWDLRPAWQFEKEKFFLRHDSSLVRMFWRPLTIYRAVDVVPVSREEFARAPVYVGGGIIGTVAESGAGGFAVRPHADQFLSRYGYRLHREHRLLVALVNAGQTLVEKGITPVFYVTPIDYQAGERFHGSAFQEQVVENVATIQAALSEVGVTPVDLSSLCPSRMFCHGFIINEHLDENGRSLLAVHVAEAARAALDIQRLRSLE